MEKKSVIVIGAGIAGLSAGCYARMNDYHSKIFEMHALPGGLCTAWKRGAYTIDGCVHWLVGSKPGSAMHQVWQELGAVQGRQFVYADEFQTYEDSQGKTFHLYANVDRLEEHMREIAPEDMGAIERFCNGVRQFLKLEIPVMKPFELMSPWEKIRMGAQMLKLKPYMTWNAISMADLLAGFKSPLIRRAISGAWPPSFPAGFILSTLAWLHTRSAGYPIGGSMELSRAIERRYLGLGGEIQYRARIAKILVEGDRAVGVKLEDGSEHRADYVVSAADAHATIFDFLEGRYIDPTIRGYFEDLTPFPPLVFVALGIKRRFDDVPVLVAGHQMELPAPLRLADSTVTSLGFHIFNNDPTLAPEGHTVVACMFTTGYDWWKNLQPDPARYAVVKSAIVESVIAVLEKRFPGIAAQVEMKDIATPLTFERYTGNWRGSFEGWMTTPRTWMLRVKKTLPGLSNFWMCGQWVEPGGGLPPSALSGRGVVQCLCAQDRKPFVTARP